MTWIANTYCYFVLDLPGEMWRATKEFVRQLTPRRPRLPFHH
jgi:hypothetical protein